MGTITTAMCTSFKQELMEAKHNFTASTGHVFKIALIKPAPTGTYDNKSTNYSNITGNSDEVTGTGYTAGGVTLTNETPATDTTGTNNIAYTTFNPANNPSWSSATFSTAGCMIYNTNASNAAVGVWSFGGTQSVTSGTFTVLMPAMDSTNALIRLT